MYPEFVKKMLNLYSSKEKMMQRAMALIRYGDIKGDYLEFGVWNGNSFSIAYKTAQANKFKDMKFYAFDSFEGLPETKGIDIGCAFKKGDFSCSVDKFKSNLKKEKVDLNKVFITKGWYDKVLTSKTKEKLGIKKAALIMIDSDLYSSAKSALDFIKDEVQDGTVIMFDDWFCFGGNPFCGERRAFSEWLEKNPDIIATEFYKFHTLGNSFILHKKIKGD